MTNKENTIYRLQQLKMETRNIAEKLSLDNPGYEMEVLQMIHLSSTLGKMIQSMKR